MMPGRAAGWIAPAALALLGLCGVVIVLLSTHRYGPATIADSDHYLATARNLLAGHGYTSYPGTPYTQWPPLFPTLLAGIALTGVDPLEGARWLNALAFGLIVFLSGRLFAQCVASQSLAVAGALATLASKPLLDASVMVMSEPLFIVLALLLALCLPRYLHRRDGRSLMLISVLAGLACLQRYVGISLVLAGVVLIGLGTSGARRVQRVKHVAIFAALSALPMALWCIRNRLLIGEAGGGHQFHPPTGIDIFASLQTALRTASLWVFPWVPGRQGQAMGLVAVAAGVGALIVLSRVVRARPCRAAAEPIRNPEGEGPWNLYLGSALGMGATYFGFVVLCGAWLGWHPEWRHMTFLYPFFTVFLLAGIAGAGRLIDKCAGHARLAGAIGVILYAFWLQYPLRVLHQVTIGRMAVGAGGYATAAWQDAPLVQWLRDHPLSGPVYSNSPDGVYLLTRAVARYTPQWRDGGSRTEFAAGSAVQARYVVWFRTINRPWLYDLRELSTGCRMEEVVTFPEGSVLRCLGPGGPGLAAVYRFWLPRTGRHFFTADKQERNRMRVTYAGACVDEDAVFYAYAESRPGTRPVHRFWSERLQAHLYTLSATEKSKLEGDLSGTWAYQGVAFYAYPEPSRAELVPVYRLVSRASGAYLYTAGARERERLVRGSSPGWIDEGIAWYAYGP